MNTRIAGDIAVTYDNSSRTDGVGAQLQRIYGLYALSRALGIKYVHTPLGYVGNQGLLSRLTGRIDPMFVDRYNALFRLPSDEFDLADCERVRLHDLDEYTVERYRKHATTIGRAVLLEVLSPYGYTDAHPSAYHVLRGVSPYRNHEARGPIRVCVHVRRGDVLPTNRQRWLPNDFFVRVCAQVVEALGRRRAAFVVRLHSELAMNAAGRDFEDFAVLPNLQAVLNVEPHEALHDFATADVLILGRSSFGYLGGLLNPQGLVIYAPFWHAPLPDWLVAGEDGALDHGELASRVADIVRRRC